jgi:hypothetical protein
MGANIGEGRSSCQQHPLRSTPHFAWASCAWPKPSFGHAKRSSDQSSLPPVFAAPANAFVELSQSPPKEIILAGQERCAAPRLVLLDLMVDPITLES